MNATDSVVDFIAATSLKDIPEDARHLGKRAVLDTLGVSLAGATYDAVRILLETARDRSGKPTSGVIGTGIKTDCLTAAQVNGTMAHALDFDDVNDSMMGHPSAPLMPAVMALGEEIGATGARVLEAFLIGFEVECKLGPAIGHRHYAKGWHATCTLGTIGVAAATAKLLGLDKDKVRMALGIAASLAGGVMANFGTMTKPLHVGEAARNGTFAALSAQNGFTASADIFDHVRGYCRVFSEGEADPSRLIGTLGSPWDIVSPGLVVKKYPCCNNTHRTLDATLALANRYHPPAGDIDRVVITAPPGEDLPLIYSKASTGLEGKFCMQFCVASALHDGEVGPDTFEEDRVRRPEVQGLSDRVKMEYDLSQEEVVAESKGHVEVKVVMRGGEELLQRIERAKGTARHPLTDEELTNKYSECARSALGPDQIRRSVEMVYGLENLADVRELMGLVSCAVPQKEVSPT